MGGGGVARREADGGGPSAGQTAAAGGGLAAAAGAAALAYWWMRRQSPAPPPTGWARVGSSNLNWVSFVGNYELDVQIEDEGFARQMEERYEQDLARSTMQNYRRNIEEHLLPAFEDIALADISAADVAAWERRERAARQASRPGTRCYT